MDSFVETADGVVVSLRAAPKSSRPGLEIASDGTLRARVKAAPVDGKANKEIVEVVADAFGVAKSSVSFKGGETSKTKRLLVKGVAAGTAREVLAKCAR